MTQPNQPAYTAADVELVADAIWTLDWPEGEDWVVAAPSEPEYRPRARAALDALAAAGRIANTRPTPHLDAVKAERDKLVETVGRMISLPPHLVAEAYGVTYTGEVQP